MSARRARGDAHGVRQTPAPRRGPVDRRLRTCVLVLVGFGLLMVYSASSVLSLAHFGKSTVYFTSQFSKAVVGLALMFVLARVDYRIWGRLAKPMLWVSIALLIALIAPLPERFTPEINGASRWLAVQGFTFQPIELAKLALIVWLAATIVKKDARLDDAWSGLAPLLVPPLLMAGMAVLQPDFKGASVLVMLTGAMLWLGGVRAKFLLRMAAAGIPLGILVMVLEPYRMERIRVFLDRGEDLQGISYQINQSLISLGSGGWFGVGLGSSKQKFAFLPMAHTDFIASIVGEELGLLGTLFLLGAFLYLGALGCRAARRAPDGFGFLLASGITTMVLLSALLNLGVATASLPTTGLPLPFISYGGTALIVQLAGMGIVMSVSRDAVVAPRRRESPARAFFGRRAWGDAA
ncbi:MAG TPA: putative lipid II flippase FtsW [Gemmatimonadota bacterium]|nr:putative lipid II flippase FtsW [Gemmatimonadota bacterium]